MEHTASYVYTLLAIVSALLCGSIFRILSPFTQYYTRNSTTDVEIEIEIAIPVSYAYSGKRALEALKSRFKEDSTIKKVDFKKKKFINELGAIDEDEVLAHESIAAFNLSKARKCYVAMQAYAKICFTGKRAQKDDLKNLLCAIKKLFSLAHSNYYALDEIVQNKAAIKKLGIYAFTRKHKDIVQYLKKCLALADTKQK